MLKLSEFKQALTNIVRPNRFLVYVTPPVSMQEGRMTSDKLKFWATSASLPDRSFNEIAIKYYGMEYKIPAGEIIQDLSINFLMDEEHKVREFFETWAYLINDRNTSQKGYTQDLYDGSLVEVNQFDGGDNVIAAYRFNYIFPKVVDQIELNYETIDSASQFQVTFAYSYWERLFPK